MSIDVKFTRPEVAVRLSNYFNRIINTIGNFEMEQPIFIYLYTDTNDFVAFESTKYNLSFMNPYYKPSCFYLPDRVKYFQTTFKQLFDKVNSVVANNRN